MNRPLRTVLTGAAALALVLGSSLGVSSAAFADELPESATVQLTFTGYDAEIAASNGYDVRTDAEGWQYAVPTGTPAGSTEGATPRFNPETGEVDSSGTARNTVPGSCGTSTLTLYTKTSGYTAYNLNGAFGGSVFHAWNITLSASTGATSVDRCGLPPFPGSLSWGTNFAYSVNASASGATVYGVASGVVTTTLGTCTSGAPRDSI